MTVAYQFVIKNLLDEMHSVYLVGNMCSGKTTVVHNLLKFLNIENYEHMTMNVSRQVFNILFSVCSLNF